MLIESMTREETFREIMRDLPLLKHWQRAKWKDELRSKFAHCPVFPAHAYRTWTSPNKNKWETYFYCVSKKQVFRPESLRRYRRHVPPYMVWLRQYDLPLHKY